MASEVQDPKSIFCFDLTDDLFDGWKLTACHRTLYDQSKVTTCVKYCKFIQWPNNINGSWQNILKWPQCSFALTPKRHCQARSRTKTWDAIFLVYVVTLSLSRNQWFSQQHTFSILIRLCWRDKYALEMNVYDVNQPKRRRQLKLCEKKRITYEPGNHE